MLHSWSHWYEHPNQPPATNCLLIALLVLVADLIGLTLVAGSVVSLGLTLTAGKIATHTGPGQVHCFERPLACLLAWSLMTCLD